MRRPGRAFENRPVQSHGNPCDIPGKRPVFPILSAPIRVSVLNPCGIDLLCKTTMKNLPFRADPVY